MTASATLRRNVVLRNEFDGDGDKMTFVKEEGGALVAWVAFPDTSATAFVQFVAGLALFLRLLRWGGAKTTAEPCTSSTRACCVG